MFNDLEEIIQKFDINSSNISEILKLLKEKRTQLHPDKTGGDFKSDDLKSQYELVDQAIHFLESGLHENNDIVSTNKDVQKLVEIISKQNLNLESSNVENKLSETINNNIVQFKSKSFFPKVSSSTITILITYIFMFPNTIQDNLILSKFIDTSDNGFLLAWEISFLIMIELWVNCFIKENKNKEILAKLKTETYQNTLFMEFTKSNRSFSRDDLLNYILNKHIESKKFRFLRYINIVSIFFKIFSFITYFITPQYLISNILRSKSISCIVVTLFSIFNSIQISTIKNIYFNIDMNVAEELTNNILLRAKKQELIIKDNNCKSMSDNYKLCI